MYTLTYHHTQWFGTRYAYQIAVFATYTDPTCPRPPDQQLFYFVLYILIQTNHSVKNETGTKIAKYTYPPSRQSVPSTLIHYTRLTQSVHLPTKPPQYVKYTDPPPLNS